MLSYLSIYQKRKEGSKKKREKEITQQEIKL